MGEQLSGSSLKSNRSLSPSWVPTALFHTTQPAQGKLQAHWRPPGPEALLLFKGQPTLLFPWLGLSQVERCPAFHSPIPALVTGSQWE